MFWRMNLVLGWLTSPGWLELVRILLLGLVTNCLVPTDGVFGRCNLAAFSGCHNLNAAPSVFACYLF
jgi:hypothetical protein